MLPVRCGRVQDNRQVTRRLTLIDGTVGRLPTSPIPTSMQVASLAIASVATNTLGTAGFPSVDPQESELYRADVHRPGVGHLCCVPVHWAHGVQQHG